MATKAKDKVAIRGFARFQIVDAASGKAVTKKSKWYENTVVNLGFQDYVCGAIGAIGGSKQVAFMAIGTGTAPGAASTSLAGETGSRYATSNSCIASKTMQSTCQFLGADMASTCTIQNVALVNATATSATILSGTTYATSQWASNQNVNATYQLRFS